jgi:anti-sigma regulatory factor (Ser/Thr protein kinase)
MSSPGANGGPIPGLELELPPKPAFVRTARHAVGALARLHDLPEDLIEDIKLAVSEACNTAVAGAEGGDPVDGGAVRVSVWVEGGRFVIEVVDPRGKVEREVSGSPAEIDTEDLPFERLLSLPLIRGLVDDMSISAADTGGVRTRMFVSIPSEAVKTGSQ